MVCKHQEAVLFWLAWEGTVNEDTGQIELPRAPRKPKRKTYPRNWPAYNAAQIEEKARVEVLLKALCEGIEQPPRKPGARGRNAYSRRDAIFGCVLKVYTTFSGRRADTDISACAERGSIGKAYHPNTLFRAMEDPATTPILLRLIEESAAPLAEVENRAGPVRAGLDRDLDGDVRSLVRPEARQAARGARVAQAPRHGGHAHPRRDRREGVERGGLPAPARVARDDRQDVSREGGLGRQGVPLKKKNLEAIDRVGAVPFIPFKSNSVGMASTSEHWRRMWCLFSLKSEEFRAHYHRRSNVESTMWMIKSKFGAAVRSKRPVAQVNEILAKLVCHNLACIVRAVHEFGIDVDLGGTAGTPTTPILAPVQP